MLTAVLILAVLALPYALDIYFGEQPNSKPEESYDYR